MRILVVMMVLFLCGCTTTEGEKVGQIVKVSMDGVFISTCEATLIRGGFEDGSGVNGERFNFTIKDKLLVDKAKESMNKKKSVKIRYHNKTPCFWSSESDCVFVDDIEVL